MTVPPGAPNIILVMKTPTQHDDPTHVTVTKIIYSGDFDVVPGSIIKLLPSTPREEQLINFQVIYCPNNEFTNEITNVHIQELI